MVQLQLHSLTHMCKFHSIAANLPRHYNQTLQSVYDVRHAASVPRFTVASYGEMEHRVSIESCCSQKRIDDGFIIGIVQCRIKELLIKAQKSTTRSREHNGLAFTNRDQLKSNEVP